MASTKEYRDYILEQLFEAGFSDVRSRPMMGEYLLYVDGVLVGGIYDDRLLVKIVPGNEELAMEEAIPYPGAKAMWLVGEADNTKALTRIVRETIEGIKRE